MIVFCDWFFEKKYSVFMTRSLVPYTVSQIFYLAGLQHFDVGFMSTPTKRFMFATDNKAVPFQWRHLTRAQITKKYKEAYICLNY